jgi:sec-independent protein translocase protein TatB
VGFGFEKLLVIGVVALFLLGPDRLPDYAARLAHFVRAARRMVDDAKERVREEMGPDFDEDEWRKLAPRQYDPRRIIRDALLEPDPEPQPEPQPVRRERSAQPVSAEVVFDPEAT